MNVIYTIIASFTNGEIEIDENNVLTRKRFKLSNCGDNYIIIEQFKIRDKYILIRKYIINWLVPLTLLKVFVETKKSFHFQEIRQECREIILQKNLISQFLNNYLELLYIQDI